MKKGILYCCFAAFLCVVAVGCANMKSFVSNGSGLMAPIENHESVLRPDFQFLGKVKSPLKAGWHKGQSGLDGLMMDGESVVYGQFGAGGVLEKAILVRTYEIRGASEDLLPDIDFQRLKVLGSATQTIADHDLSSTLLIGHAPISLDEKRTIGHDKISTSDCYLIKTYSGKLKSYFIKSKSHIFYLEKIDKGNEADASCKHVAIGKDDPRISDFSERADQYVVKLLGASGVAKTVSADPSGKKTDAGGTLEESGDLEHKLSTLKSLLDKGLITPEEYHQKKMKLLENY